MLLDRLGPSVDLALALRIPEHAAFGGEDELVAPRLERPAEQRLIGAEAVQRGRVEMRVAGIQRLEEHGRRCLRLRRRAVGVRQAHAAEADGRDAEWAECARLHKPSIYQLGVWVWGFYNGTPGSGDPASQSRPSS